MSAETVALRGALDYAGVFPPAQLDLALAAAQYAGYRTGPESWLVHRFVCRAAQLGALAEWLESHDSPPFVVSVVGSGGATLDAFESGLESDAKAMTAFENAVGERAEIDAFETVVPVEALDRALNDLRSFSAVQVYAEIPVGEGCEDALDAVATSEFACAKGRTGGLTEAAVPSAESLARFLVCAADLELGFKLTAGLHEPIRHFDAAVGADVHGFLNVLAATAARLIEDASTAEVTRLLELTDPAAFSFDASGLRCGAMTFALPHLLEVRELFHGFGSCSVDEPLAGLAKLHHNQGVL